VALGIIPAAIPHLAMTLLSFSATELGTKSAFLAVWSCHHSPQTRSRIAPKSSSI
jgi:hypothetical protein